MKKKLASTLDRCLETMGAGEPVEVCLEEIDDTVRQVKGMLEMASALAAMPRVEPSRQFRETAQGRLMARLGQEASRVKVAELEQRVPVIDDLVDAGERLRQAFNRTVRLALPVTLTLLVAVVLVFTASNLSPVPAALATECTLSILGGSVEVSGQAGADGMTLQAGTHIKTSADSRAILTFFDGSTVTLEPGTELEIQQAASNENQGVTIVMKQWAGRTWSRVVKMADAGSRYEIETPTATAIVRGTLFTTEVDELGATTVATTEGLVSVAARGEEVFLPPQQQTSVNAGETPAPPSTSPAAESRITVRIGAGAVGSVVGPAGASTGQMPGGIAYNQIPGSQYLLSESGVQEITIPEPTGGEYTLVLRFTEGGAVPFNITGMSGGQAVFSYAGERGGDGENGYIIRFRLEAENGLISGGQFSGAEPLQNGNPEKIVMPDTASLDTALAGTVNSDEPGRTEAGVEQPKIDQAQPDNMMTEGASGKPDPAETGLADTTSQTNESEGALTTMEPPEEGNDLNQKEAPACTGDEPAPAADTPVVADDPAIIPDDTSPPATDPEPPAEEPEPPVGDDPSSDPQPDHGRDDQHGHGDDEDDGIVSDLLDGVGDLLGGLLP